MERTKFFELVLLEGKKLNKELRKLVLEQGEDIDSPGITAPEPNQPAGPPPTMPDEPPPSPDAQVAQNQEEAEITVDTVIDNLNKIRGGNSFKDPVVYGKLTAWFNGLDPQTRNSLNLQLGQVAEMVLTPQQQQAQAQPEPMEQGPATQSSAASQPTQMPAPQAPPGPPAQSGGM